MNTFLIPTDFSLNNKEHVYLLQLGLITMDYKIDSSETSNRTMGASTKEALSKFQQEYGLAQSEKIPVETINQLNLLLQQKYRICGYITDCKNKPVEGVRITCNSVLYKGESLLGETVTLKDGSFRIFPNLLSFSLTGDDGLLKNKLCITLNCTQGTNQVINTGKLIVEQLETIFNFSSDALQYQGDSIYTSLKKMIEQNGIKMDAFPNMTPTNLVTLSACSGTDKEIITKLLFSYLLSNAWKDVEDPKAFFACLYQSIPFNMPTRLFDDTVESMSPAEWDTYKSQIVQQIQVGLVSSDPIMLNEILTNAVKESYISYLTPLQIKTIIELFTNHSRIINVSQAVPLLEGNVTLDNLINGGSMQGLEEKITFIYEKSEKKITEFLHALDTDKELRETYGSFTIDSLSSIFKVSRSIDNFLPLVTFVGRKYAKEIQEKGVFILKTILLEEWKHYIEITGFPEKYVDSDKYAQYIYEQVQSDKKPEIYLSIGDFLIGGIGEFFSENKEIKTEITQCYEDSQRNFDVFLTRLKDNKELRDKYGNTVIDQLTAIFTVSRVIDNFLPLVARIGKIYTNEILKEGIVILKNIKIEEWIGILISIGFPETYKSREEYANNIFDQIKSDTYPTVFHPFGGLVLGALGEPPSEDKNLKEDTHILFIKWINNFPNFIAELGSDNMRKKYDSKAIDHLVETFEIGRIVRNYPATASHVLATYQSEITEWGVKKLAVLTLEDWKKMTAYSGKPKDFEDTETYAAFIYNNMQKLYPDITTIFKAEQSEPEVKEILANALLKNPDFNLLTDRVETLKLGNFHEQELKKTQQAYRIAPTPEAANVLLNENLYNSGTIYFTGKQQLVEKLGNSLKQEDIDSIYNMASARFSNALCTYTTLNETVNGLMPASVSNYTKEQLFADLKTEFPDIETLFGDTAYCSCEHDKSVYSSAAYLADLLTYMSERIVSSKASPNKKVSLKTIFDARRSDISNIYLNKENTNTLMPYIDLVCEALEESILKESYSGYAKRSVAECQSTLSSKELCAAPEHILKYAVNTPLEQVEYTAYDVLKGATYPMFASLDLAQKESNAYLQQMGIKRFMLMQCFQNKNRSLPENSDIASEFFEIAQSEKKIITAEIKIELRNAAWNGIESTSVKDYKKMSAENFLANTRLSMMQILDICNANWIGLTNNGLTDCSTKNKYVEGTMEAFDRAHRFIRFWQKSDWNMWELNLILKNQVLCPIEPNTDSLRSNNLFHLMLLKQQQMQLQLNCESLLAFYGNINCTNTYYFGTQGDNLYKRLFLNTSIANPVNVNLKSIYNNPGTGRFEKDDYSIIAAGLSVSTDDIEFLMNNYPENQPYDLKALSYLYRNTVLAKKLRISVRHLLMIQQWTGIFSPECTFVPEKVSEFVSLSGLLKTSPLSLPLYEYLLNYEYIVPAASAQTASEEHPNASMPTLSQEASAYIISEENLTQYKNTLQDICENKNISDTEISTQISNCISDFFGIAASFMTLYLKKPMCSNSEQTLLDFFTDPTNYENEASFFQHLVLVQKMSLTLKGHNLSYENFSLLLTLQNKVGINWFGFATGSETSSEGGTSSEGEASSVTLDKLSELHAMLLLQQKYGTSEGNTLLSVLCYGLGSVTLESLVKLLSTVTGWNIAEVNCLTGTLSLTVLDFYKSKTYTQIENGLGIASLAGVPMEKVITWKSTKDYKWPEIKETAKAKYDIDRWLEVMGELQKPIREAKADALASYLIAADIRKTSNKKGWKDRLDVYNYYLLDTEMSSLMKTSRIVQATCSIQLFIQRCTLDLEKEVVINESKDTAWKQWEWMKKYRLWEANRKVFLYPENWIEPELRDDKTPFFMELEEELTQSDITAQQAETVYENYLQKLYAVSNLTVCGIYHETVNFNDGLSKNGTETEASKVDTLHVIGKTKSSPSEYYYRNYNALNAVWSHWEKIELDIKGESVVPVVYNRRLHLFWLTTVEKTSNNSTGNNASDPDNYTEIQLGWSILKNKKWSAVKYSQKKHIQYGHFPNSNYSLVAFYDSASIDSSNALNMKNEILFTVYNLFYINTNKPEEYHSCNFQSGMFYFDGEVRSVVSNINHFSKYSESDIEAMKKIYQTLINQHSLIHNVVFIYYLQILYAKISKWDEAKKELFKKLIKNTNEYEKPDALIMQDEESCIYPARSLFLGGKLHTMEKDDAGVSTVYLHDDRSTNFYTTRLLSTSYETPNLVQMMHNQENMWYGLFQSHLYHPFFYQDMKKSFFVMYKDSKQKYVFSPFYHPYAHLFLKELNRFGVEGLLNREIQLQPQDYHPINQFDFQKTYNPSEKAVLNDAYTEKDGSSTHDILDFSLSGAYSSYNWELFFHTPLYIACKLSQNQKYEEAMRWFHYIFNPMDRTNNTSPQKYWITKPFFELSTRSNRSQQITNILKNIESHAAEVNAWLNHPFQPHLIARTRIVAYQKTVVMKYIDNLIAWADQLFRRDTMEYNNEATLLYVLAYQILGKRPVMFPAQNTQSNINYNNINGSVPFKFIASFDNVTKYTFTENLSLSNVSCASYSEPAYYKQVSEYATQNFDTNRNLAISKSEPAFGNSTAVSVYKVPLPKKPKPTELFVMTNAQYQRARLPFLQKVKSETLPRIDADHFCIPFNEELFRYWDTVEDRLFKLRNCMNIEGIVRELPLFEPPIDPAMLVKAAAAGLSIGEALNDINVPQPYYRFRIMVQKAVEFTNEVKQLGDKLLSALEKKDAETLSLLRSNQEITLQKAMKQLRKLQIDEARQQVNSINESIRNMQTRCDYYSSREYMNGMEASAFGLSIAAGALSIVTQIGLSSAAAVEVAVPEFITGGAGIGGSPVAITQPTGGIKIAGSVQKAMNAISVIGQAMERSAALLTTQAGYKRRKEEWDFQAQMAKLEINQLNKQLAAAEIRVMLAEKELENLEMQIEQSQSVKEYYQSKYTNEALYNWMITQLSGLYFQAYTLAYDTAKKAEKSYCHELGIYETTSFIQFGYWDSLKKGLLAGDKLIHDLHRLDAAYLDNNRRTLELTKHVSLAQIYPNKLAELIQSKETVLSLEEFLFDMDYPGHYKRRIKSVSVTIPNVAGPYTTVSFMLTLLNAKIRKNADLSSEQRYKEDTQKQDSRFVHQTGGIQSICTGSAQNDSGLFELNFGDERYLPFENAGAISQWKLKFPAGVDQFDLSTVSDVVLHIQYTAVYDGILETKAREALQEDLPALGALFFSPKQDFPDNWNQMSPSTSPVSVGFAISNAMLPYFFRGYTEAKTVEVVVLLVLRQPVSPVPVCRIGHAEGGLQPLEPTHTRNHLVRYQFNLAPSLKTTATWKIEIKGIAPQEVEDLCIGFALNGEGSEENRIFNSVFMEQFK